MFYRVECWEQYRGGRWKLISMENDKDFAESEFYRLTKCGFATRVVEEKVVMQ